ncbi:antibiotic biosynthesis monooxygenase [Streptomyces kaniharaensis]|uniref:Antibiotic biosynthesis monooxygenase n=1 Tax=Streptomyces kaniharaensis TaxID=212423 RepID=A0A6N7KYD8_9ACTN|nr:antibiotic biosynthesis monooxygenase family protein [Streptomyces kaniharaensis]MQS16696.1 antibiotic biosynthesis monooxygenase [Streptomyces kaniharaensis]
MLQENKYWSSGNWQVGSGKAEEFVEAWRAFLTWTKDANDGFLGARLIQDIQNPQHFVSFATWRDIDAMRAWQGNPDFAEHFGACRALCEDVQAGGYELSVDI